MGWHRAHFREPSEGLAACFPGGGGVRIISRRQECNSEYLAEAMKFWSQVLQWEPESRGPRTVSWGCRICTWSWDSLL